MGRFFLNQCCQYGHVATLRISEGGGERAHQAIDHAGGFRRLLVSARRQRALHVRRRRGPEAPQMVRPGARAALPGAGLLHRRRHQCLCQPGLSHEVPRPGASLLLGHDQMKVRRIELAAGAQIPPYRMQEDVVFVVLVGRVTFRSEGDKTLVVAPGVTCSSLWASCWTGCCRPEPFLSMPTRQNRERSERWAKIRFQRAITMITYPPVPGGLP